MVKEGYLLALCPDDIPKGDYDLRLCYRLGEGICSAYGIRFTELEKSLGIYTRYFYTIRVYLRGGNKYRPQCSFALILRILALYPYPFDILVELDKLYLEDLRKEGKI